MAGKVKHSLAEVLAAVEAGHTRTGTARALGVSRKTVWSYAQRWPSVAEALEDQRAELVDLAEAGLRRAVERGEPWAVTFALKTLGREVYSERHEVTGAGGLVIELRWTDDIADKPA